ncbi:MAG: chromate efflux transporter [Rhizobiaceae bacterium]
MADTSGINRRELIATFLRIGVLSFGGPAAQIALMHRVLVEEKRWLGEREFTNALGFCMLLPGPEAMQLATYSGWRIHGISGGLIAGLLFVLPGSLVILALAAVYAAYARLPAVDAIFLGIKAAVLVIVVEALLRISRKALGQVQHYLIAILAFLAIFIFAVPFPLIIAIAALYGAVFLKAGDAEQNSLHREKPPVFSRTLATIFSWMVLWWLPVAGLAVFGAPQVFADIATFFSKLAVVTFGGAYAVLAYMAQQVVGEFGWLNAGEMLDGLGLAESTPGPLILVTEFVGFVSAHRQGGLWYGIAGAALTLWVTFVPCFLWIFAGAPYIERISAQPRLTAALSAITAAVVGVILNLSIWFGLHVFFGSVNQVAIGPLSLWLPELASLDWRVLALAFIAAVLLLRLHLGMLTVLAISASLGLAITAMG